MAVRRFRSRHVQPLNREFYNFYVPKRNYFPKFKNENLQLSKVFPTICHNFQIIFLSILQASKDIFPSAGLDKHVSLYYP